MVDAKTLEYYARNAGEVFRRYHSASGGVSEYFSRVFQREDKVLDVGAGSGRDVLRLLDMGVDAFGLEPCGELTDLAQKEFPQLRGRMMRGALPDDLGGVKGQKFDGLVCSAVFMHIPEEDLLDSVFALRSLLKDEGILVLSVPSARDDMAAGGDRDTNGRLMVLRSPWDLQLLFERTGFELKEVFDGEDSLGRPGHAWTTLVFRFREETSLRPIDKIEGILNRDKKDATYKLALFRALCDLALTNFRQVRWVGNRKVSVAVDEVARKWLQYYWPLFESEDFIPQKRGERLGEGKKIAFRRAMNDLVAEYRQLNGLGGFLLDLKSNPGRKDFSSAYRRVMAKIENAIIKGPVVYAGGSLETGTVFDYDKSTRRIVFSADIWRELVLMGHWIRDSLILRWAELTAEISRKEFSPSFIIDKLLTVPDMEREVRDAREFYKELRRKECVWTGQALAGRFDVDHAIPFALWHNNDLWNLLPAHPRVNNQKRDRLPGPGLVKQRKDGIIYYWQRLRGDMPARFDTEANRLAGMDISSERNWENKLFSRFRDSIEYTAIQRSWQRWQPAEK